ncbi:MAG TPA: hypothetical protein VI039_00785 [Solirubrobacterales bacterium]
MKAAALAGVPFDLTPPDREPSDPSDGDQWSEEATVPAGVIRQLAEPTDEGRNARRVHIRGARIEGILDLSDLEACCAIQLIGCRFEEPILLDDAQLRTFSLRQSFLAGGLWGRGLRVAGDLELYGHRSEGTVNLQGAETEGDLNCNRAEIESPGEALFLDGAVIGGNLALEYFSARGETRLLGGKVHGQLDCTGATMINREGDSFSLDGSFIGDDLICADGFVAEGTVRLPAAHVVGDVRFGGAALKGDKVALRAEHLRVDGAMRFGRGFKSRGSLLMAGVRVKGSVLMERCKVIDPVLAIDLDGAKIESSLSMTRKVTAEGEIRMHQAQIHQQFIVLGATFKNPGKCALSADHAVIGGSMFLGAGFVAEGEVRGGGIEVKSQLSLSEGSFLNPDGLALLFDGCRIGADVMARNSVAEGMVRFPGSTIEGAFEARGATFRNGETTALVLDSSIIRQGIALTNGFQALGGVRIVNAEVTGPLNFVNARLRAGSSTALTADRSTFRDGVFMAEGFEATGEVRMLSCRLGGQLTCAGGTFENHGETALTLEGSEITSTVFLSEGFRSLGKVDLSDAVIGGEIRCNEGWFSNLSKVAFAANRSNITGGITFSGKFRAEGEVQMLSCTLGSHLLAYGARFENDSGDALSLDRASIAGELRLLDCVVEGRLRLPAAEIRSGIRADRVKLRNVNGIALFADRMQVGENLVFETGFVAEGDIRLSGARVSGQSELLGVLSSPKGLALDVSGASLGDLYLRPREMVRGTVDLGNAEVGHLWDDWKAWTGDYVLDDFSYSRLDQVNDRSTLRRRLAWLRGNRDGYRPQIYDQLARTYRSSGHEDLQREVLVAKQRQRRDQLSGPAVIWNLAQDLLVGFGYRTWKALIPFAFLVAAGTLYFAAHSDDFEERVPTQNSPPFKPLTYTLDLLLPVVELGQRSTYTAHHAVQTVSTVYVLIGWIATTAIIAAMAALLTRPVD